MTPTNTKSTENENFGLTVKSMKIQSEDQILKMIDVETTKILYLSGTSKEFQTKRVKLLKKFHKWKKSNG